jgi:branched-chain amino acid transport system permease protein
MLFLNLGLNAIVTGLALGCIYALVALGLSITFGLLHVPNVAHPAMVVAGSYAAAISNSYGLDPLVAGALWMIPFYIAGFGLYEFYSRTFESRGRGNTLQSLTLFFGISLIIEVGLVVAFGTDLRSVQVSYVGRSLTLGMIVIPYRLLIPAALAPIVIGLLWLYLSRTNAGLAMRAVAYEERALQICGRSPAAVKRHAFGVAMALASLAGAALVVMGPVDPFAGRSQLGRVFAIVVLAGMGAIPGTLLAAILIGLAESLVTTFFNPSWAPGVAFAILLVTLGLRPNGLFGMATR